MKFFNRDFFEDVKKDLAKNAIKYFASLIGLAFIVWITRQLNFLNTFFQKNITLSVYTILFIGIAFALVSSVITFILFNLRYQKLKKDSLLDELTGLYNEKAVADKMKEDLHWARSEKKPLSLILLDVDNFKKVNDSYLLKGGDKVMQQLGAYLVNDSRATDTTFRQHAKGDEFLIITRDTNAPSARLAAERKRRDIKDLDFQINDETLIKITVSCGIAEFDIENDTDITLIDKANKAMLKAKQNGKDCSILYE
jgi:diguanylate cyclase (GGDEF)-like protein